MTSQPPLDTAPRTTRWGATHRDRERRLLAELAALDPQDPRRTGVRDELVTLHLPLVHHLARRYRDRGESLEDLVQIGTVGLIKSVDRFDPDKGVEFSTYASPTIIGEIKRHFRDHTWAVRVPRRLQELTAAVTATTDALTRQLGRSPTVREIAESLGVSTDDVLEALEARQAYSATSLDAGRSGDPDQPSTLADTLGMDDVALDAVEDREALRPLLAALPERERAIIVKRFVQNKSQTQIAQEMGISQMHVSRLLAKTLGELRRGLSGP